MSSNVFNPRRPRFWLAGAAVAAAFFASGALVARATIDRSGDSNPSDGDRAEVILPGLATGESAAPNVAASYGHGQMLPYKHSDLGRGITEAEGGIVPPAEPPFHEGPQA